MDALQRAGGAQHRPFLNVEETGGFEGEERSQPLAGPEGGVAHGLGQAGLGAVRAGQQLVQRHGDQIGHLRHAVGDGLLRRIGGGIGV